MKNKFNIEEYNKNLTFDEDIVYNGVTFTPVKVDLYEEFYIFINCLLIDKDSIPDINILKMSYLDYIFYLTDTKENQFMVFLLASLISICTNIDIEDIKYKLNNKNEHILLLKDREFDKKDFLILREIICAQNDVDVSIFNLDPRVREEIRKTMALKEKNNTFEMGTLEEQIICILISCNLNIEQIRNLSLRKFKKILNRIDHKLHYEIYESALLSGNVTFKEEIQHWLSTLEKNTFNKYITSYEETERKIKMSNNGI